MKSKNAKLTMIGIAFLSPAIILFLVNVLYPTIYSFDLSFYKWNGFSPVRTFVGLKNYIHLFHDRYLNKTIINTLIFVICTTLIQVSFALCIALMIESVENEKVKAIYRTLVFIPALLSPAITGLIWENIFHPQFGLLHQLFGTKFSILGNRHMALYGVIFVNIWKWTGHQVIIYVAGLQAIERSIIEAAILDGANRWNISIKIYLPLLKVSVAIVLINGFINGLKAFDLVQVMTHGGPNHSSEILGVYMYNVAFEHSKLGYASSIGYVLAFVTMVLTFLYFKYSNFHED